MRRLGTLAALAALCALLGAGGGATWAAFSGTTTNSGNRFTTAATFASCSAPGTTTLTADADTWVGEETPDSNYATQGRLSVIASSVGHDARALVRFPLPAVPSGCQVTSAELRLTATFTDPDRTIDVLRAASAWGEATATWNNRPGVEGTPASAPVGSGLRTWDVAAHVRAHYAGTNNGFVVKDADETGTAADPRQQYQSRDSLQGTPPQLVVTFG